MNALSRVWKHGAADADQRVARTLAPRSFQETDRYLGSSAVVRFLDGLTLKLESWWTLSVTGQAASAIGEQWLRESWVERHRVIGVVLLVAALTHVALTMLQGPRPGWFWMLIPGMVMAFAVVLLAGSRSAGPAR
jgi:hypothetical protein